MRTIEAIRTGELRERIESGFGQWGRLVANYRWAVIGCILLLCSGLFSQLRYIQFDGTFTGFFNKGDPALEIYDNFREQYGRDDNVIVLVETDDVFTLDFLEQLKSLHQRLEDETPYLVEIESLVNARYTEGSDDTLYVKDFLEQWPTSQAEAQVLKQKALDNPSYRGIYLSEDARYAAIQIKNQGYVNESGSELDVLAAGFEDMPEDTAGGPGKVISHEEENAIKQAIDAVVADFDRAGFRISIAGGPYSTAALVDIYAQGMARYTGLAIILIGVLLLLIFRRVSMVFLPLVVAFLAMLSALSPMAFLKIPVSFSMQIVPSFLIAVGVGNSVHICTIFYQALERGLDKTEAIAYSLQHSGLAIVMTGLTTAGGLLSFLSSGMKPIVEFGTITPLGVLFALLFSLSLLPALLAVIPARPRLQRQQPGEQHSRIARLITRIGHYSVHHPKRVVAVWLLLVCGGLLMASKLQFSFWVLKQLPPDHEVALAIKSIDDNLSGIVPLEFIVDSGKVGGVKEPAFLHRLDTVNALVADFEAEGYAFNRALSIVDINKELHQALNGNDRRYYAIPDNAALVAQELLLFENSGADDLAKVVDSQFRYARITVATKDADAVRFKPMLDAFLGEFEQVFAGYDYIRTGILDLTVDIFNEMYVSMAKSYIIAFMVITPLMVLLIGSLRLGLLCMLPNLAPIVITLGVMGATGINLTTATLLVGSIAMGLVVDDTIHFMHNFQRYFQQTGSVEKAVDATLASTGLAITITTLVLTAAFLVFVFNTMLEWVHFGLVASCCIFLALWADITLAPALLSLTQQSHQTGDDEAG